MSRQKTHEEFEKELKEKQPNLELLSRYINSKTPITCRCDIHDCVFTKNIYSVFRDGCPICNGNQRIRNITVQEYKKRLKNTHGGNIELIGDFTNINTRTLHKCNKHNLEWSVTPYSVLRSHGCKLCGEEFRSKGRILTPEEYRQDIYEKVGNEFDIISDYENVRENVTIRHNVDNPHVFQMNASVFKSNPHCPACSERNRVVIPGVNDFHTFHPELSIYLNNYNDGFNFSKSGKKKKVELKCPDCGHIFMGYLDTLIRSGFSCPCCSDGISYPNKFIYNSLLQIKDEFNKIQREYYPRWCIYKINEEEKRGYYDIYFELKNGQKYIIEMDGAIGHGDKTSPWSKKNSNEIDNIKERLALEHDIKTIRIDCRYGSNDRYSYILNNIKESELSMILPLNKIDFNKSNDLSLTSYMKEACNLWNSGLSRKEISNAIGLNGNTITHYLRNGAKYGMCDYNKKESRNRSCNIKVICITTMKIFDSMTQAADYYGTYKQGIAKSCNNSMYSAGKSKTGQKLKWMLYEDYEKMNNTNFEELVS